MFLPIYGQFSRHLTYQHYSKGMSLEIEIHFAQLFKDLTSFGLNESLNIQAKS